MSAGATRAAVRFAKAREQLAGGEREVREQGVVVRGACELEDVRRGREHRTKRRMVIQRVLAHARI